MKINVNKILKKIMVPFFYENDFDLVSRDSGDFIFEHKLKSEAKILYAKDDISRPLIEVVINSCSKNTGPTIYLSMLLNGPDNIDFFSSRSQNWYYETKEELLGLLEVHMDLFNNWVFDWLLGKKYKNYNFRKIIDDLVNEKINLYPPDDEESYYKFCKERDYYYYKWLKTRFYPNKLKLEDYDL